MTSDVYTPQDLMDALEFFDNMLESANDMATDLGRMPIHPSHSTPEKIRFALRFTAIALGEPSETATDLGGKAAYQRQVDIECEKYLLFGEHPTHAVIDAGFKAMIQQVAREATND